MGSNKKALITGGTGFIGSALVRFMLEAGYDLRVLDNHSRGAEARLADVRDGFELVTADIRDADAVRKAARGMDSIIHLAYVNGTEFFYTQPRLVLDVGVRGMLNVLDACEAEGVGDLVLASSSEVYQTPETVPTDETAALSVPDPMNPRYSYGGGKIISELLTLNWGREGFDRVLVFRPHNVYGPDMGWEHVLPQFALRMKALCDENPQGTIPFPIQGNGRETRSFIYIDDFTAGLGRILEQGEHRNIYHIGTRDERSIRSVAESVAGVFDRDIEVVPGKLQPGGTLRRCPDISKLESLGFEPRTAFDDGVRKLTEWYVQHADQAPKEKT